MVATITPSLPRFGEIPPLPPYPPNDPRWHERDRFGLAIWPPSLIAESTEERHARIATVEQLAADLFKTANKHLGRQEARRLFAEVAKSQSKIGKRPNRDHNHRLLEMYDSAVREAPDNIRSIPRLLAKQLYRNNPSSVPAAEKQIRRLVKDRSRRQKAMEDVYRHSPRSLLSEAKAIILNLTY